MLGEIAAGLSSLKAASDIIKGLNAANTQAAINDVKISLQERIFEARDALSAAQDAQSVSLQRIRDLEKEVATLKAWDADKERYKLTELRPGVVCCALKEGMEKGEPSHRLCASCYNGGHKSFLADETWHPGRAHVLVCHDCGAYLYLSGASDAGHKNLKPEPYRGD